MLASPTLYGGQTACLGLSADHATRIQMFVRLYNAQDELLTVHGPELSLEPNDYAQSQWQVPDTRGQPIAEIGLECTGAGGTVYVDYLTWDGAPDVRLTRPTGGEFHRDPPLVWRRAWVDGMDQWEVWWREPYRLVQNSGRGLLMQGTREWRDYTVSAVIQPTLMAAGGIGARVQGMRRYYALLLCQDGIARLLKALDGDTVLAEAPFAWESGGEYALRLQVQGCRLRAWVNEELLFDVQDEERPLRGGGAAFVLEEGHMTSEEMGVGK